MILLPSLCLAQAVRGHEELADRVNVSLPGGTLSIHPLTDNAVRIRFWKGKEARLPELVFTSTPPTPGFQVSESPSTLEVRGKKLIVALDKQTGCLSFADGSGKVFLNERANTRKLTPNVAMNETCFVAEQGFESPVDERLFGLGQFQDGHYNLRNVSRRLTQVNSQISIPFVCSSKGYGLLWHQYGLTDFNPADNSVTLEKQQQPVTGKTQAAVVTTISGSQKIRQDQSLYAGQFNVSQDGLYSIFLDLGDMDNRHYVAIDGKPCIDVSNFWLPPTASALLNLKPGVHQLQLICKSSNNPRVSWKRAEDETKFRSPNAKLLDYVVFYGPSTDSVIATYRNLSGNVPMLPRWAYGFWQCRERYTSGTHLVETVKEFRRRNLPMDVIVQDWQYWGKFGWGVMKFDEANYPNPAGFIKELHDLHASFSISVWENPDRNSDIGKEYAAKNLFIPGSPWLDALNPRAREAHWDALNQNLFSMGVDSWWMDATEPENDGLHGKQTYLGPGDIFRLTYPLFISRAIYEGQRKTSSDKRVCILTRSAFLGAQRYGIINWSGDIGGNWDTYKRQIVAGLNNSISGLPYWTTDIGGFFRPGQSQYTDPKYQELLVRWYQWGAFNPIFRIHGYQTETEPWKYGPQVEESMRKMLNLRYRLLPYIYSDAYQITAHGSTMMRPLVMDFRDDSLALNRPLEYMFGKSFLVAPVTEPEVNQQDIYLPISPAWYDFWAGERFNGGQTIRVEVPRDQIPLFVKAGSIIPMGAFVQYANQQTADSLEIRIYPGADGEFTLYEDENDNYNYEKGSYSTIAFTWDNANRTLNIGERRGSFPGMLAERKFNVVQVARGKGNGMNGVEKFDKEVIYHGKKITVQLQDEK
jgi:alpha-D-xyloside xylohydrolase